MAADGAPPNDGVRSAALGVARLFTNGISVPRCELVLAESGRRGLAMVSRRINGHAGTGCGQDAALQMPFAVHPPGSR
jgi:hypothetical protein